MAHWLLKTEPDCYAWDDLVRDESTVWDGVSNALALKYVRTMKKGDLALVYHTGQERSAVGVAEVRSNPYVDPNGGDERLAVVDLRAKEKLSRPVSLSDIKADPAFGGWEFLRIGRLGVVPVPEAMWQRIMEMAGGDERSATSGSKATTRVKAGVQTRKKTKAKEAKA